jgi:hypothetical protein
MSPRLRGGLVGLGVGAGVVKSVGAGLASGAAFAILVEWPCMWILQR